MSKKFKDLNLSSAFLFAAALEDPETCRLVLELILGRKLPKVRVRAEHSILASSDFRSVRFDIYASDETQVAYNIEAQNANEKNLAKRSRYHQAQMDVTSLKPGDDFNDLKPGYVIFICTFDPFGKGLYRYTFEERCLECGMGLGDGTSKIFLNTLGKNEEDVPEELVHFLRYMEESTEKCAIESGDAAILSLHEKIRELKNWRDLEARYMTGEELIKRNRREGRMEGLIEGQREGRAESVLGLLEDCGTVPEDLREKIFAQKEEEVFRRWLRLAAGVSTIEEFLAGM